MKTIKQAFRHTFVDGNATGQELMIAFLPIGIPAFMSIILFCATHGISK